MEVVSSQMNDIAIKATGIGKMYNIGALKNAIQHDSLRDKIADAFKSSKRHLAKRKSTIFGIEEFWAVKDVSFTVNKGEVFGIIGVNGAGKSTLLKILCRVTSPTTGNVVLHGKVGTLLEVGTGFNHELTGRENTYLSGAILGMKKSYIDEKYDEIIAFSGIEKFVDTPVKRYSSGMLVRLGFAVAAHLQPDILLVDEVLAVGDASFRKKCLGKMHDVANEGRTVIFVSHNMRAITSLCNRAIRMHAGQIVDEGNPAAVVDRYLSSGDIKENISEWSIRSAPSNEFVSLLRVAVKCIADPTSDITMADDFQISIDYLNRIAGSHLAISLHLFNEQGDLILNPSNGKDQLTSSGLTTDAFNTVFSFPGNVMNSGRYLITLLFVEKGGVQKMWIRDILTFRIHDKSIKDVDAWYGKNPGLVVIDIPTSTTRLE